MDYNYSGSKFQGSRPPWRDLICISGTIALNAAIDISTQWDKESQVWARGSRLESDED
jgi:hypothetical protein